MAANTEHEELSAVEEQIQEAKERQAIAEQQYNRVRRVCTTAQQVQSDNASG
jgi:hypothetical protein